MKKLLVTLSFFIALSLYEGGVMLSKPCTNSIPTNIGGSLGLGTGFPPAKLLQKIEELTLYVIELKKENETLKAKVSKIESQIK